MFLSPYALLQASKPKPPQPAAYDLYSLSQTSEAPPQAAPQENTFPAQTTDLPAPPVRRTHYIADIHTKHTKAMQRAPQSPSSL